MTCNILSLTKVVDSVDVYIQDQNSPDIDLYMHQALNDGNLLAVDTVIDTSTITLTAGHGAVLGNIICIREGVHFTQFEVLSVVVNVVTIDSPMDKLYTSAGATVCISNKNMNVDGSVTPVIFRIEPLPLCGIKWDITRIMGSILSTTSMDDGKFGGLTALTKGVVFRKKNGIYKNLFNAKTNGGLRARMYDVAYATKAPAGLYGMSFRRTYAGQSKAGVTVRLDAADSDELQVIIQDDLTGLDTFNVIVQGHLVED